MLSCKLQVPTCKVIFCNWDLGIDGTLLHHLRTSCVAAMVTSTDAIARCAARSTATTPCLFRYIILCHTKIKDGNSKQQFEAKFEEAG